MAAASGEEAPPGLVRAPLRALWPHVRPNRRILMVAMALSLVAGVAGLIQPLAARWVIDSLGDDRSLEGPIVVLVTLALVGALLVGLRTWVLERTAEQVALRARLRLAAHLLRLRVSVLDRHPVGDLLARETSDTTLLRAAATSALVSLADGGLTLVATIALMAYVDWFLLLLTLAVLAATGIAMIFLLPRIGRATMLAQAAVGQIGARLERALVALRTVKASGAEERERVAVADAADGAYRQGLRLARYQAIAGVASGLAIQVAFLVVLGLGGARVADGSMGIGTLVAFLLYLFYLIDPVSSLISGGSQLQSGLGALARIEEAERFPVESDGPRPAPAPAPSGGGDLLRLEGVRFRYRSDTPWVLQGIDLSIPEGGQTALVGPSGAGKSTLFGLIERFYDPDEGRLLLRGRDLRDLPLAELRAQIGYVEQNAPILAGTLGENLRYAAPGASEEAVMEAVAEARLDDLLDRLGGLDGEVGPRGLTLSGGEAQRVAIARALLRRPRLLLLDEVTAQVDAVNERALREAVARAARRCTVIVIAHRLSTVVAADRIVVLDGGRARAIGSHDELVAGDALYRELAVTQLLEAEGDAGALVPRGG